MSPIEQLRAKGKLSQSKSWLSCSALLSGTLYKEVEDDHVPFFRVRTSIDLWMGVVFRC
jgi:hypothetical protein